MRVLRVIGKIITGLLRIVATLLYPFVKIICYILALPLLGGLFFLVLFVRELFLGVALADNQYAILVILLLGIPLLSFFVLAILQVFLQKENEAAIQQQSDYNEGV